MMIPITIKTKNKTILIRAKFEIKWQDKWVGVYHKRKLNLDDTSLMLIKEELPPKLMEQFAYECLDGKNKSKVITTIEIDNAQDFIRKKSLEKGVNENTLFEKRDKNKIEPKGKLTNKYSSFLED